ncbi:MAG: ubiquinone/menaquinone biosynthesis C-methylase UbiE [Natronomonas sp.]|jgi:ubiquinone/menaquinone biosynthesis C-methylase UbiE|uniref:class I SAM-dependent methyltransferase n=1 Tax=Natronomonas sp. TaxID=2184060 RepID=UPI003989E523
MGCGTGANLPHLRERVEPDGRVIGVDITRPLLDRAAERVREYDNVAVVQGDAARPPIEDADAVLGTFVCGLFGDPATIVEDWCDLVGDGGRIALMDAAATDDPLGWPLNPLFRAFVAAGAPSSGVADVLRAPFGRFDAPLSRRVADARAAVADRAVDRRYETFGLGFVGLLSGRVR